MRRNRDFSLIGAYTDRVPDVRVRNNRNPFSRVRAPYLTGPAPFPVAHGQIPLNELQDLFDELLLDDQDEEDFQEPEPLFDAPDAPVQIDVPQDLLSGWPEHLLPWTEVIQLTPFRRPIDVSSIDLSAIYF